MEGIVRNAGIERERERERENTNKKTKRLNSSLFDQIDSIEGDSWE